MVTESVTKNIARKLSRKYKKPYIMKQNLVLRSIVCDLVDEVGKGPNHALVYIGRLLANGSPVMDRDYVEARKFFELAADEGNAYAEFCVGKMYHLGHGVEVDYEKAYGHYMRAYSLLQADDADTCYQLYFGLGTLLKESSDCEKDVEWGNELITRAFHIYVRLNGISQG